MAPLMQAVSILEPLDKKYPDHPGITHYLIHSYDFAPIAQRGIPAANKYAKVAPAAPHAQHMPSHIYSMVGMWQPSIESNLASVKVANEYAAQSKLDGVLAGVPHAYDFMAVRVPAARAGRQGQSADRTECHDQESARPDLGGQHRACRGAGALLPRAPGLGWCRAAAAAEPAVRAGRGHHALRARDGRRALGDVAAAQADIAKLKELRASLLKANQGYWAEQVEVQVLGAQAWATRAQGDKAEAQKLMRAAADLEDGSEKHVAMENRLYPMRELLADMLLADGDAAMALKEYEVSMKNAPNRLRGWYGAAKAATAVGDATKVVRYSRALEQLTQKGDGDRPEVLEMRPFARLAPSVDVKHAVGGARKPLLAVMALLAASLGVVPPASADPTDEDPSGPSADPDVVAGKKAIDDKRWADAIKALSSAALRDTRNADIQNYLGYAYRNAGQMDKAFAHYERALKLNPRHRGAHEYVGEAYLMVGKPAQARSI